MNSRIGPMSNVYGMLPSIYVFGLIINATASTPLDWFKLHLTQLKKQQIRTVLKWKDLINRIGPTVESRSSLVVIVLQFQPSLTFWHFNTSLQFLPLILCNELVFAAVWPDGYLIISIFGHLEQWKFARKDEIFAKVSSQFCQIPTK